MAENTAGTLHSGRVKIRISGLRAAAVVSAVCFAAAAVFFIAFADTAGKRIFPYSVEESFAHSADEAAQIYFEAFAQSDHEKYLSVMPPCLKKSRSVLFDNDAEFYESYRSQFEDEGEYYSAIYGADFKIDFGITERKACGIPNGAEGANDARKLYVDAGVHGSKLCREYSGTLTAVECDDRWYIYDIDFEEAFW